MTKPLRNKQGKFVAKAKPELVQKKRTPVTSKSKPVETKRVPIAPIIPAKVKRYFKKKIDEKSQPTKYPSFVSGVIQNKPAYINLDNAILIHLSIASFAAIFTATVGIIAKLYYHHSGISMLTVVGVTILITSLIQAFALSCSNSKYNPLCKSSDL